MNASSSSAESSSPNSASDSSQPSANAPLPMVLTMASWWSLLRYRESPLLMLFTDNHPDIFQRVAALEYQPDDYFQLVATFLNPSVGNNFGMHIRQASTSNIGIRLDEHENLNALLGNILTDSWVLNVSHYLALVDRRPCRQKSHPHLLPPPSSLILKLDKFLSTILHRYIIISSAVRRFGGVSFCYVDRHIRIRTVSFYWQSEQRVAPTIFILTLLSKRVIHAARSSLPIALSNQTHSFDWYIQTRTKYSRRTNVVAWIFV